MSVKKIIIACVGIIILIPLLYLLYFREQVTLAIDGNASPWLQSLIDAIYPRLSTERYRFPATFFVQKADQVILRCCLIMLSISIFSWWYTQRISLQNKINIYFGQRVTRNHSRYLIAFLYLFLLCISWDIFFEYQLLSGIQDFYKPIFPLKYVAPGFPGEITMGIIFGIFVLSCLLSAFRIASLFSSIAAILSFMYLYSIRMGFEKIDHGFTTIVYTLLLFPFFIQAYAKAKKMNEEWIEAWSLQLIKFIIPMCYFMAALEKLLVSGIWWLKPESFKTLLYIHQEPLGLWVMQYDLLCIIFPIAAWLFQFCFISILKWPRLTPYFLITGVLFHEGTYFLLGAGGPFTPWIAVYAVYLIRVYPKTEVKFA